MDKMEKVVSLAKRRGFVYPGSEIYGGLANSWDFGPVGVLMKNNIRDWWWNRFVQKRDDMVGIDAAIFMSPKVWEASRHIKNFTDPLIECKKCHTRYREDQISEKCSKCGSTDFTSPKQFNLMFKTAIGATEEKSSDIFLRPEIAQAMFVNFKNVLDSTRMRLPFGIASIGKAFRNEITPGNFVFRTLEFDLMEFEYFIREKDWEKDFNYWLGEQQKWLKDMGFEDKDIRTREHDAGERAHYSKRTVDIEYNTPFGWKELFGLAYRTDYDLKNHQEKSGQNLEYTDPDTGDKFIPHVIEPTFGLTRLFLMVLLEFYKEDQKTGRVYLKLHPKIAPYKVAVFPLLANKKELLDKARNVYKGLKMGLEVPVIFDDRGNIGKRYYSQDEIGTPWCITVDFKTLEDDSVTIRERDTAKQERIKTGDLINYFNSKLSY